MLTHVGLGFSHATDPHEAGALATRQATSGLGGHRPAVIVLFATPDLDPHRLLSGVHSQSEGATVLGCCAPGVIVPGAVARQGVGVAALAPGRGLTLSAAHVQGVVRDPRAAARALVESLRPPLADADEPLLALLLKSSGEGAQSLAAMIQAAGDELGPNCLLVGGGAQDSTGRVPSPIYWGTRSLPDAAALLVVRGGAFGVGAGHGYRPVGPPLVVSRARGNAIDELAGRSAFETYAAQFVSDSGLTRETFARFALDHPLGLPQIGGEYVIRDPYAVSTDGALLCAGAIPERSVVRLMEGDPDALRAAAEQAARAATTALGGAPPALALVCSCVSRLNYLGDRAVDEVRAVQASLGEDVPLIGFFSYGEIAATAEASAVLHNKTVVVGVVADSRPGEER